MNKPLMIFIILLGVIFLIVILGYIITGKKASKLVKIRVKTKETYSDKSEKKKPQGPEAPQIFGYKCVWLAVRANDMDAVVKELNIKNCYQANWTEGLEVAYDISGKVFVSPPLDHWILVIGLSLPDTGDSKRPDKLSTLLQRLSSKFGEVQYFGTHRVVDYHSWIKAKNGKIIRGYAYLGESGETLLDIGEKTKDEMDLGFNFYNANSPEAEDNGYWDRTDLRYPNEEDVLNIAKRWSIDTSFENSNYEAGFGLIGTLSDTHP